MLTTATASNAGNETTETYRARVQDVCTDELAERINAIFPTESA